MFLCIYIVPTGAWLLPVPLASCQIAAKFDKLSCNHAKIQQKCRMICRKTGRKPGFFGISDKWYAINWRHRTYAKISDTQNRIKTISAVKHHKKMSLSDKKHQNKPHFYQHFKKNFIRCNSTWQPKTTQNKQHFCPMFKINAWLKTANHAIKWSSQ